MKKAKLRIILGEKNRRKSPCREIYIGDELVGDIFPIVNPKRSDTRRDSRWTLIDNMDDATWRVCLTDTNLWHSLCKATKYPWGEFLMIPLVHDFATFDEAKAWVKMHVTSRAQYKYLLMQYMKAVLTERMDKWAICPDCNRAPCDWYCPTLPAPKG